jgi:hypothetical protein
VLVLLFFDVGIWFLVLGILQSIKAQVPNPNIKRRPKKVWIPAYAGMMPIIKISRVEWRGRGEAKGRDITGLSAGNR